MTFHTHEGLGKNMTGLVLWPNTLLGDRSYGDLHLAVARGPMEWVSFAPGTSVRLESRGGEKLPHLL